MTGRAGIIAVVEGKDTAHTTRKPGFSGSSTDGIISYTQGWPQPFTYSITQRKRVLGAQLSHLRSLALQGKAVMGPS